MSRFANSIGIWDLKLSNVELDIKPKMLDVKAFRNILVNDKVRKDKQLLFDKFADFMYGLIKKDYPEENETEMKEWIEVNLNKLFEEAMIAFKWSTREDMEKTKLESESELKKIMSDV